MYNEPAVEMRSLIWERSGKRSADCTARYPPAEVPAQARRERSGRARHVVVMVGSVVWSHCQKDSTSVRMSAALDSGRRR